MFVTEDMIAEMAATYGPPEYRNYAIATTERELARIRSSQKDGRNHDVTLYVQKGDRLVVIAKPIYPPGLYRAPSGGLKPGESFADGIRREMAEEIGCEVTLSRFLLQTAVDFYEENSETGDRVYWRSFVFLADYHSGDFDWTDREEIREVRLVTWGEFTKFGAIMRASDLGGLHYRAALHETVAELTGHTDA